MKLEEILKTHRKQIVDEWIYRLHTEVSERYRGRPVDELFHTVSRASEANYEVLIRNDFSKVNDHIHWITNLRLEGGFSLSEVQSAYELYRTVGIEIPGPRRRDKRRLFCQSEWSRRFCKSGVLQPPRLLPPGGARKTLHGSCRPQITPYGAEPL